VSQHFKRGFPEPSSVNQRTGSVLWKASPLFSSGDSLKGFFTAAQTKDLPFFILVAGSRIDYASYCRMKLPESVCSGSVFISAPIVTEITKAFLELSEQSCLGPLPPSTEIKILNSDEDNTGITLVNKGEDILPSPSTFATSSSGLKNWLQEWQNSHWYGCMSQILMAAKAVISRMEDNCHVFLAGELATVLVGDTEEEDSSL
jgi:hypothetical protein